MLPDEMPEVVLLVEAAGLPLANVIRQAGLAASTSEALRLLRQGAVRIDGEKVQERACQPGGGICASGRQKKGFKDLFEKK